MPANSPLPETDATVELVARTLPHRAALLSRRLAERATTPLSRTELGLLFTLTSGPRRITDLADSERLAQPTVTLLVKRLEARGWVARERDTSDGRVVHVHLTDAGRHTFETVREEHRSALRAHLAALPEEQIRALAAASDALVPLIEALENQK